MTDAASHFQDHQPEIGKGASLLTNIENMGTVFDNLKIVLAISVMLIVFLIVGIWANAYIMRIQHKRRMRGDGS